MIKKNDNRTKMKVLLQYRSFWYSFILFVLAAVFMVVVIPDLGVPFALGAILMGVVLLVMLCFYKIWNKRAVIATEEIVRADKAMSTIKIPKDMPLPYAILNEDKKIVVCNTLFKSLFSVNDIENCSILDLIPDLQMQEQKQRIELYDTYYDAFIQKLSAKYREKGKDTRLQSIYLVDMTEVQQLKCSFDEKTTVVALVFIDNYEEVLESMDDSSLPLLTALVDRKLNSLATETAGIMKKVEKDRYIFLLDMAMLEKLKEKKFEILNEIREIKIGEHIPVTLSIGIGIGWDTLDNAMKNARAAIDLALGRGGDQVLIKDGEKYLFYGGKSGEVGHNARIRARVKADALWELIGEASEVFVMGHKQGDLDSFGSAIGIYAIVKMMHKPCYIILNAVSDGVKQLVDRLDAAGGYESLLMNEKAALEMVNDRSLVIITDTHRRSRVESESLLLAAKKTVVFDHHRKSTDFIDNSVLMYHEPYASSTSELVTEMIQYFGERIKLKQVEADALLAGITLDTKNFCIKTGAITFEAAAYLRRSGADSVRVRLLFQNNMDAYKAKAAAVRDAELFMDCIAISICPSDGTNTPLTAAQAADDLLNIAGIRASFVLCQMQETIFVSARSYGDMNVQLVMEGVGGGGHLSVSGAQLTGMTLEEAKEKIKNAIRLYLQEES